MLPGFDASCCESSRKRWEDGRGQELREYILGKIREGAGEDFLQLDFEGKKLGFLESQWDLRGIDIFGEDLQFDGEESGWFEAVDFSYAELYHSKFRHASFNSHFSFARIFNCEFIDCTFSFTGFYGTTLEKVKFLNCDFIEQNAFVNCDFRNAKLESCFIPENIFVDCRFDGSTIVTDPIDKARRMNNLTLDKRNQAQIFQGIKEAYTSGGIVSLARLYYFRQMQAITRFNCAGRLDAALGYLREWLAGYGVRPMRVLVAILVIFVFNFVLFSTKVGIRDGLVLSAGGLFTFGGYVELLRGLGLWYELWYVCPAFLGMALVGLYVTVWANVWLRER